MGQYFGAEAGPGRMHCGGTLGSELNMKLGSKLMMSPTFVEANATTARSENGSMPTEETAVAKTGVPLARLMNCTLFCVLVALPRVFRPARVTTAYPRMGSKAMALG